MAKRTGWDDSRSRSWPVVTAGMEKRVNIAAPGLGAKRMWGVRRRAYISRR